MFGFVCHYIFPNHINTIFGLNSDILPVMNCLVILPVIWVFDLNRTEPETPLDN